METKKCFLMAVDLFKSYHENEKIQEDCISALNNSHLL